MKQYTVLLADDNASWLETMARQIVMFENYKIVEKSVDGRDALVKIQQYRPDIILLDIIMPHYDGTYIVNFVRTKMKDYNPIILMISGLGTDSIIQTLSQMDIDYYLIKPVSAKMVMNRLNDILMTRYKNRETLPLMVNVENLVESYLNELGLPTRTKSYRYLRQALIEGYKEERLLHLITKYLYPVVARAVNEGNVASVERGIRHAINTIEKTNTALFSRIFDNESVKVTNGEFLTQSIKYLKENVEKCDF